MKLQNTKSSKTNGTVKQNHIRVLRQERGCCERYIYVVYYARQSLTNTGLTLDDRTRTGTSDGTDEKTSFFSSGIRYR